MRGRLLALALLLLPACATMKRAPEKVVTLPVGASGPQVLHDALRVLGKPADRWNIKEPLVRGGGSIDVLSFKRENDKSVALYFFQDTFVQLAEYDAGIGWPAVRPDYREVDKADGPRAYVLEKSGPKIVVRAVGKKR